MTREPRTRDARPYDKAAKRTSLGRVLASFGSPILFAALDELR